MELNETKTITRVRIPGSYFLFTYFSNTHCIIIILIDIEEYKI